MWDQRLADLCKKGGRKSKTPADHQKENQHCKMRSTCYKWKLLEHLSNPHAAAHSCATGHRQDPGIRGALSAGGAIPAGECWSQHSWINSPASSQGRCPQTHPCSSRAPQKASQVGCVCTFTCPGLSPAPPCLQGWVRAITDTLSMEMDNFWAVRCSFTSQG